jgi:hypothetical protein
MNQAEWLGSDDALGIIAAIPPNKLRKMARTTPGDEELLLRKLLEQAIDFAFLAICATYAAGPWGYPVERYSRFLCSRLLREIIREPFAPPRRR